MVTPAPGPAIGGRQRKQSSATGAGGRCPTPKPLDTLLWPARTSGWSGTPGPTSRSSAPVIAAIRPPMSPTSTPRRSAPGASRHGTSSVPGTGRSRPLRYRSWRRRFASDPEAQSPGRPRSSRPGVDGWQCWRCSLPRRPRSPSCSDRGLREPRSRTPPAGRWRGRSPRPHRPPRRDPRARRPPPPRRRRRPRRQRRARPPRRRWLRPRRGGFRRQLPRRRLRPPRGGLRRQLPRRPSTP